MRSFVSFTRVSLERITCLQTFRTKYTLRAWVSSCYVCMRSLISSVAQIAKSKFLAPVVQRVDNAIQRISIGKTNYAIRWIVLTTLSTTGARCLHYFPAAIFSGVPRRYTDMEASYWAL